MTKHNIAILKRNGIFLHPYWFSAYKTCIKFYPVNLADTKKGKMNIWTCSFTTDKVTVFQSELCCVECWCKELFRLMKLQRRTAMIRHGGKSQKTNWLQFFSVSVVMCQSMMGHLVGWCSVSKRLMYGCHLQRHLLLQSSTRRNNC